MRRLLTPRNQLILPRGMRKPAQPILDASHPLSRGLVGYWPLGQTTSVAYDLVAGAIAPAVNGPLAFTSAARGGVSNTFNGSTQSFTGVAGLYSIKAWSVSAWVYCTSNPGLVVIAAQADAGAQNYQFWVGNTGCGYTVSGSSYASITTTALTLNVWHHVVAGLALIPGTANPTMYYYTDGVLTLAGVTANGGGTITSGQGTFAIGKLGAYTGGLFWPGNIENVRIYDRMLSGAEASQLYAEPFAGIYEISANIGAPESTTVTGVGAISLDIAIAGVTASMVGSAGTIGTAIAVSGVGASTARSAGAIALNIALAATNFSIASGVGSVALALAVAGAGQTLRMGAGSVTLNLATVGRGATVNAAVGAVAINIAVAGGGTHILGSAGSIALGLGVSGASAIGIVCSTPVLLKI